jgi:hypothetical protein
MELDNRLLDTAQLLEESPQLLEEGLQLLVEGSQLLDEGYNFWKKASSSVTGNNAAS